MKVAAVVERDDGGADVVLEDISKEELHCLIQEGFLAMLRRYVDEEEKMRKVPAILKGDSK